METITTDIDTAETHETSNMIQATHKTIVTIQEQLFEYLKQREYQETLLLDMLRAKEISQKEYDRIMAEYKATYKQFKEDLSANKNTN